MTVYYSKESKELLKSMKEQKEALLALQYFHLTNQKSALST